MDINDDELDIITAGEYEIEAHPEMLGEISTHHLLLAMDDDELFNHMKDPAIFNKVDKVRKDVLADVAGGSKWGSIYE